MALTFTPFGLNAVTGRTGSTANAQVNTYAIAAAQRGTSFYENMPVNIAGAADEISGKNSITVSGQQTVMLGVFVGVEYTNTNGEVVIDNKWIAGTPVKLGTPVLAKVYDNPEQEYDILCAAGNSTMDLPVAGSIAAAQVGLNATFGVLIGNGNNSTGKSYAFLSTNNAGGADNIGVSQDFPLNILSLSDTPDYTGNAFGVNYNIARVRLNNTVYRAGTAGQ